MKLNKKECRKAATLTWSIDSKKGIFRAESIKYVIRTALKNIGGHRVLVLYIYSCEDILKGELRPVWVMFQGKDDYVTLARRDDGTLYWRKAAFENLGKDYQFVFECAFYSEKDEQKVLRFCAGESAKGFVRLECYQRKILRARQLERRHRKQRIILEKIRQVKGLPRDLKSAVHKIMPAYIFYNYKRTKKPVEGYCTACRKSVQVTQVRHNQEGVCPNCGRKVTFRSRGRRGYCVDQKTMQVLQRVSEREIVIRIIKAHYAYRKQDEPEIRIYENARLYLSWDEDGRATTAHYYKSYESGDLTPWKVGERPVFFYWYRNFEAEMSGLLYTRNLDEVLKGTPWQYCQLSAYYQADPTELYVEKYLLMYQKYPVLEYFVRMGLFRLATEVVYGDRYYTSGEQPVNMHGKNIKEVLGVGKQYIPLLQQVDPGYAQMKLIKVLIRENVRLDVELLVWCAKNEIGSNSLITTPLRYMTPHRLVRYANEQYAAQGYPDKSYYARKSGMDDILTDYRDYLCMCEGLEYDLKNEFVLFPADLKAAHDKVNDLKDKKQARAYDRQIAKQFPELSERYQFRKLGFMVVAPKSAREIIREGQILHHCVGGYVKKVVMRETVILFVRDTKHPKKPLCTLEVKDGRLVQARIFKNDSPPPAMQRFLDVWKEEILNKPQMAEAA